ncbi:MAG: UDP-N-acetylglucosamine 1-carboxyvinyltransferase [Ilumatobacteraceae bacterium]|nr:UDP-N-acetylglucosamine 1-carboxyvinyltransferase [Ilumatobacteraceae bacterium]
MKIESPRIIVRRSGPLSGSVQVPGAKNSVLKLMAATLLAEGDYVLTNVPAITDVHTMAETLGALGVSSSWLGPHELSLTNSGNITPEVPFEKFDKMRASLNVLGPLLTHYGSARINWPGGDDFGGRPINLHVAGLQKMGATVEEGLYDIFAVADRLKGTNIELDIPSVGATENLLTAAIYARGVTVIDNAAREPEVQDLCNMLISMGADIEGIGTSRLIIHGCERGSLKGTKHAVVPDRVQAATYMAAVAVAGGDIVVRSARTEHMEELLNCYARMGVAVTPQRDGVRVTSHERLRAIDFITEPYPGIATDYKPLLLAMLCVSRGEGSVTETLFPGRFRYIEEFRRLGASIAIYGNKATVRGVYELIGSEVRVPDIRAGAALVVAGLVAQGETIVHDIHHIDRGYDDLVGRLSGLGADVTRV